MTHEEYHNSVPPNSVTQPASLAIDPANITVSERDLWVMLDDCARPSALPPQPSLNRANLGEYLVSGETFAIEGLRYVAVFVSWWNAGGLNELTEFAEARGGDCTGMTTWRTVGFNGRPPADITGQTGLIFVPEAEAIALLGLEGVLCPGALPAHTLVKNFDKPDGRRAKRRPAFVLHQFRIVPAHVAPLNEQMWGPVLSSLVGLRKTGPNSGMNGI